MRPVAAEHRQWRGEHPPNPRLTPRAVNAAGQVSRWSTSTLGTAT
jgi:hypothetical protein